MMRLARGAMAALLVLLLLVGTMPTQTAQSSGHPAGACSAPYHISGADWDFCWQRDDPRAQGLEINRAYFKGESVAWKMGVPFSMTKYDNLLIGPFKDTLGTPGAGLHPGYGLGALTLPASTCPRFFGGTGTLIDNGKICVESRGGPEPAVAIWAKYNIYNYRFLQGWKFDARGHVEPIIVMGGNLIDGNSGANGNNHFHHLIWRVDFDIGTPGGDTFQMYSRNAGASTITGQTLNGVACEFDGHGGTAAWCDLRNEAAVQIQRNLFNKFRVKDGQFNGNNQFKSYEFRVNTGDGGADHFSTMDAMVVQYQGDSNELGYEVPTNPFEGDKRLYGYLGTNTPITDPVAWMFLHIYHDTRDEDRNSMSYHEVRTDIMPHNMFATNPGEMSFP